MEISILGLGARGNLFARIAKSENIKIAAVCDINEEQRKRAVSAYGVAKERVFDNADEFFAQGKLSDILLIATLDETHYEYALKAIELGYQLLLEKPIALRIEEIRGIAKAAREKGTKVGVCHVLRYTPFYQKIKDVIDSGAIGRVMNMNQVENVGYYHYAHSFVRGNWRNSKETCPIILAKCCHDFDLILWLTGKSCKKLSSFGELTYFKAENAPEGAATRCEECKHSSTCAYSGITIYTDRPTWVKVPNGVEENVENAMKVVRDTSTFYANCVFRCDNDVVDHQYVNMELTDGVFANLTMQAFSGEVYRRTQICGTLGEINGCMEDGVIEVHIYGKQKESIKIDVNDTLSQHCGGDKLLFLDFYNFVDGKGNAKGLTSIERSIESHLLAFYAEESRIKGGEIVTIDDVRD